METQLKESLCHVASAANDPNLHVIVSKQVEATSRRKELIQGVFQKHRVKIGSDRSKAIERLIEGGESDLSCVDDGDVRDMMVIAHCLRVYHYGVAGYGVASRLAGRLGYNEDARLLLSFLSEKEAAVQELLENEMKISRHSRGGDELAIAEGEETMEGKSFDVLILGGGPAGLSAALLLGRCMRRVLICDSDFADFEAHTSTSGFIGHDGCEPIEILRLGKEQLLKFDSVSTLHEPVEDVERNGIGFRARCKDGRSFIVRSVLLTSGFVARLPGIPGAERFYGHSLHQCPYCDGWEHRGKEIGVMGADLAAVDLAVKLLLWSPKVTLFTDGESLPDDATERRLEDAGISIISGTITALEGDGNQLQRIRTVGASFSCDAMFFWVARKFHSALASHLGCDFERRDSVIGCEPDGATGVHGLFAVGSTHKTAEFAIVAAAEGIKVAEAINDWLMEADQSYLAV